uniref:Uncharacterized protein n=1 Tax=Anguilla anguilla TaxID=7936 RepID=A0A0E9V7Q6_ANGAN
MYYHTETLLFSQISVTCGYPHPWMFLGQDLCTGELKYMIILNYKSPHTTTIEHM